ncbi:hypothetical protein ARMGADRAFT_1093210 [Armillaria gallica]|uniref:Uncharacterized protein n=1 Tax=Armillaria gallica TaxID=47427 RepID=A0A2H3CJK3_ARMGA|nr:hypothetical protein ARMGADRAFT_1093210 [Armillaria gallica]
MPELITALKSIGIELPHRPRFNTPRLVHLVNGNDESINGSESSNYLEDFLIDGDEESDPLESLVRSAYQVLKKRQRPAPKQYFFPVSDKETKLGKAPPSLCKVCSSPRHWDKECPYWERYLKHLKKKSAQVASLQLGKDMSPVEAYQTAYQVPAGVQEREGFVASYEETSKNSSPQPTDYDNSKLMESHKEVSFTIRKVDEGEEDTDSPLTRD